MAPIANPPIVPPQPETETDHEHERQRESQTQREERPTAEAAAKEEAQKPPAALAAEPARAAQLRAAGLEQLNRGAIRRAVALLQQARRLDPNSVLIKRDLDRAIRISRAVASRP
jgi:hypothetical protein